jgi:signal transduction histidine kinase
VRTYFRRFEVVIHKSSNFRWLLLILVILSTAGAEILEHLSPGNFFEGSDYLFDVIVSSLAIAVIGIVAIRLLDRGEKNYRHALQLKDEAILLDRRRLAQDLHDILGQDIAYLHNRIEQMVHGESQHPDPLIHQELLHMQSVAEEAYDVVRGLLHLLKTGEQVDLPAALEEYTSRVAERASFRSNFIFEGDQIPFGSEERLQIINLYREIIANIERHAAANQVFVHLVATSDGLMLSIRDDGCGFDPSQVDRSTHFGLKNIEERAQSLNGRAIIRSELRMGTQVIVYLPAAQPEGPTVTEHKLLNRQAIHQQGVD